MKATTSSNNNNSNNNHETTSIEAKLQGVAAEYRRQRDQAHRQKELAIERRRLATEEADAAQKSLTDLQSKLQGLKNDSGTEAVNEIQKLKEDVENLTNMVNFQHNELLGMREKMDEERAKHALQESKNQHSKSNVQEQIGTEREKVAALSETEICMNPDKKKLKDELEGDIDNNLYNKWPRTVAAKAAAISAKADDHEIPTAVLERIILGYQQQFGFQELEEPVTTKDQAGQEEGPANAILVAPNTTAEQQ